MAEIRAALVRDPGGVSVLVVDENGRLSSLPHIERHSPDGFEWSYGGSGPADLARSLLIHWFGEEIADAHYQAFKWACIAKIPHSGGTIRKAEVQRWLDTQSRIMNRETCTKSHAARSDCQVGQ